LRFQFISPEKRRQATMVNTTGLLGTRKLQAFFDENGTSIPHLPFCCRQWLCCFDICHAGSVPDLVPSFGACARTLCSQTVKSFQGTWYYDILAVHEKYGSVVWISPDEISFVDGDAMKRLYGHVKPCMKVLLLFLSRPD
jgi:hypothetical protein